MPYGFDQRWRPTRIHEYSNASLQFGFRHPARLVVSDTTPVGAERTGLHLRLTVRSPSEAEDVVVMRVRDSGIPLDWGREQTTVLINDLEEQLASGLRREYASNDEVARVRPLSTALTVVGGAPALYWAAGLRTTRDGVFRVDHWECYAPGGERLTAVCITRPGHEKQRCELAKVVRSTTFLRPWPSPDGEVWVAHPSWPGATVSGPEAL